MPRKETRTQLAAESLAKEILEGRHRGGGPLPSEHQLCARFGLSRMSVRIILERLEQRRLIYKHQGKGTFVSPSRPAPAKVVVLLLRDLSKAASPYLMDLARGADSFLSSRGAHLHLVGTAPDTWSAEFRASLAGVIVIPNHVAQSDIVCLRGLRLPHMIVMDSDLSGPTVTMEVEAAARAIAAGLLAQGHRRLALISGHREHSDRLKRQGIQSALAEVGLSLSDLPDHETDYRPEAGQAAACAILDDRSRPTAVICFDDTMALQMISTAQRRGIRIPQQLSVTGFNDAAFSVLVTPTISTVRFPVAEAGAAAAAAILDAAETGALPKDIVLGHEVLWRDSTGRAPGETCLARPKRRTLSRRRIP